MIEYRLRHEIVYLIKGPDGAPRYVGRTSQPLADRLKQHRAMRSPLGAWVRANAVQIEGVEQMPDTPLGTPYAGERERYWIERLRAEGHELFNVWPQKEAA